MLFYVDYMSRVVEVQSGTKFCSEGEKNKYVLIGMLIRCKKIDLYTVFKKTFTDDNRKHFSVIMLKPSKYNKFESVQIRIY